MSRTFTIEDDEIAIIWSAADVLEIRPDLSQEQAEDVLVHAHRKHDAGIGINWDVLDVHASWMYPQEEFSGWGS